MDKKTKIALVVIVVAAVCLLWPLLSDAATKYNPITAKWENTPADSRLEYNAPENSWSYVAVDPPVKKSVPIPAPIPVDINKILNPPADQKTK